MYVAEGELEYVIENRRYVIKKGDVLLVKAGLHHFERNVIKSPSILFCIGFSSEALESREISEELFEKGEHFSLGEDSPLVKMLFAAKEKLSASKSNAHLFVKSIAEAAVLMLDDLDMTASHTAEITNANVQKIIRYVNENVAQIHSTEDIANAMFFSPSYVRGLFKREMGIGIMQYVRNKRVLLANRKIKSGGKPTEIYTECGFSNYTSFYRAYLAYFGASPKEKA